MGKAVWLAQAVAVAGALLLSPVPAQAESAGVEPDFLKQGWSAAERDWIYNFSQGSQLLPYAWFDALEMPDSETRFRADGLARFGYLPNNVSPGNPDRLPVGFAVDSDRYGAWIGMNCSACHTNRIQVGSRLLQIDGAPGSGDLFALLDGLNTALQATLTNPAKRARFLQRIAKASPEKTEPALNAELEEVAGRFSDFVTGSRSDTVWGPARADAFGMIFNRVVGIDLGNPGNMKSPNAPVSYPFLWTTNQQDWIQWSGSVPNLQPWERLGRNVGQVLGVFGKMPRLSISNITLRRFRSTVHAYDLLQIDRYITKLKPPAWPAELDAGRVERGAVLYEKLKCGSCHADGVAGSGKIVTTVMAAEGAQGIGTDPLVARNIITRTSLTGPLKNGFGNFRFKDEEPTGDVLSKVVAFTILDLSAWVSPKPPGSLFEVISNLDQAIGNAASVNAELRQKILNALDEGKTPIFLAANPRKGEATYKAGPLNGIWATAPFLHNGSVPSLAALLSPVTERPKVFTVGSRQLNTQDVGFESGPGPGGFTFDTSQPGNSNSGHEGAAYGTTLTSEERLDLLEYLKQL
jgi:mono/diheme cytochrome c family protein